MHRFLEEKVIRVGPGSETPTEKIPLAEVARAYIKWYQSKIDDIKISDVEIIKDLKSSKLKRWIEEKYKEFMLTEHIILKPNEWWDATNKQILVNPGTGNSTGGPMTADQVNWKTAGKSAKKVEIIDDLDFDDESTMEPSTVPSPIKTKKGSSPQKSTATKPAATKPALKSASKPPAKKTNLKAFEKKAQDNIVVVDDLDDIPLQEDFIEIEDDLE